jgi:hypothetical protein
MGRGGGFPYRQQTPFVEARPGAGVRGFGREGEQGRDGGRSRGGSKSKSRCRIAGKSRTI